MPCMLSPCHSNAPVACPHNTASTIIAAHLEEYVVHHHLLNPLPPTAVILGACMF